MPDSSSLLDNVVQHEPDSRKGPNIAQRGKRFYGAVHEAAILFVVACILGLGYNAIRGSGVFGSTSAAPAQLSGTADASPTFITYEEAATIYASGNALFVDARNEYDYKLGHIKGAINIPIKEFENRLSLLGTYRKDSQLVAYCDGVECGSSIDLGKRLTGAGFSNVKIFFGGWSDWKMHDQPIDR
jgi:rhodanese-related sulfurtransferase